MGKAFFILAVIFTLITARGYSMDITVTIGGTSYAAHFEDNAAAREIASRFPLSLTMSEWAGNSEYYARLSKKIDEGGVRSPAKFESGDLALYNGVSLVIFYAATTNTAGYILLGHITTEDNLKAVLDGVGGKISFSLTQDAISDKDDIAEITMLYKEMYRAMTAKDMTAMAKIHADSFVLIHMTGTKMNKAEYLSAVKDGTLNYYTAEHDDISIQVDGNKAALCGKSRVNAAVYGGGKHTWRLQQDMTLEKIGGEWKFTHSKASTY